MKSDNLVLALLFFMFMMFGITGAIWNQTSNETNSVQNTLPLNLYPDEKPSTLEHIRNRRKALNSSYSESKIENFEALKNYRAKYGHFVFRTNTGKYWDDNCRQEYRSLTREYVDFYTRILDPCFMINDKGEPFDLRKRKILFEPLEKSYCKWFKKYKKILRSCHEKYLETNFFIDKTESRTKYVDRRMLRCKNMNTTEGTYHNSYLEKVQNILNDFKNGTFEKNNCKRFEKKNSSVNTKSKKKLIRSNQCHCLCVDEGLSVKDGDSLFDGNFMNDGVSLFNGDSDDENE